MCSSKKACFQQEAKYKAKLCGLLSDEKKDLNTLVDRQITKDLGHHKRKEQEAVNKFKVLLISSGSNGRDNNGKSKVIHTSGEGSDFY
eukprot:10714023-Ditylum_brightwellii.AAC.1